MCSAFWTPSLLGFNFHDISVPSSPWGKLLQMKKAVSKIQPFSTHQLNHRKPTSIHFWLLLMEGLEVAKINVASFIKATSLQNGDFSHSFTFGGGGLWYKNLSPKLEAWYKNIHLILSTQIQFLTAALNSASFQRDGTILPVTIQSFVIGTSFIHHCSYWNATYLYKWYL